MDQNSIEFAQRMIEIRRMTLIEQLADLKYRPEEITENTYLYVDQEGHLAGMEKMDVNSYPAAEYESLGYVRVYAQSLASIRSELALSETLTAAEVAERFRLADDTSGGHLAEATVRQAINRGTLHGRKSHGTWLVWLQDARAMKGWVEIGRDA